MPLEKTTQFICSTRLPAPLFHTSQVCMYCLEKTIQFISYFGFIFVAVQGDSFCKACFHTFGFIFDYPTQVVVNAIVCKLLTIIIQLSIPAICAFLAFTWLDQLPTVTNATYPAAFIALCGLVVAGAVSGVFDCVINTVFICAFKDVEENEVWNRCVPMYSVCMHAPLHLRLQRCRGERGESPPLSTNSPSQPHGTPDPTTRVSRPSTSRRTCERR